MWSALVGLTALSLPARAGPCADATPETVAAIVATPEVDLEACFLDIARSGYKRHDFPSVVPLSSAALAALRGTPHERFAVAWHAMIVWSADDLPNAIALYEQVLRLDGEERATVDAYASLAMLYRLTGRYEDAVRAARDAVTRSDALHGPTAPKAQSALIDAARAHAALGDLDAAIATLADAERRTGGAPAGWQLDNARGDVLLAAGELEAALEAFQASAANARGVVAATPLSAAASVAQQLGRFDVAEQALRGAVEARRVALGPRHASVAPSLVNLAKAQRARADLAAAQASIDEALVIFDATPAGPPLGALLLAAGVAAARGDHAAAADLLGRADAAHAVNPAPETSDTVDLWVLHARAAPTWREAREWQDRAWALASETGDALLQADTAVALGSFAYGRADPLAARRWYDLAMQRFLDVHGPEHPAIARVLTLTAQVAPPEEAIASLTASLELKRRFYGEDSPMLASTLRELAERSPDPVEAVALVRRACAVMERAGSTRGHLDRCRITLGAAEVAIGDPAGPPRLEAAWAELAPSVWQRQEDASIGWEVVRAWSRLGDDRAVPLARDLLRLRLDQIDLPALSFREADAAIGHRAAEVGVALAVLDGPGDVRDAYEAVVAWRDIGRRATTLGQLASRDPATAALTRAVRDARGALADAVLAGSADTAALLVARDEAERALAGAVPHDALGAPTVDELCAALTPGAVLVEWVRLPGVDEAHHYSAFVLDHACGLRRVDLGDAAPIDDAAQAWRARIGGDAVAARVDRAGDHLRALAWDPLDLPDDAVLYAIPDGGLAAVAFAGLPAAEGGYLLERAHIRYLDAARDLRAPPAAPVGRGALVVGDVDLGAARDGLPLPCGLDALPPLPGTAREAADVARRLRRPVTVLTGAAADEASVEALVAGKALVHLATHGVFALARCYDALPADAAPLSRSGVALAGVNAGGVGADDGLWTAEEIASADLASTSLVVLSACDTGLGDVHAGTGVLGLRHALAAAGARATITSLWALPDDGTAHLIDDLYRRLRSGVQPSDALRAAQLAALAKARARSGEGQPAAWAGLVASGP